MSALHRLWALREERPGFVAVALLVLAWLLAYPLVDLWLRQAGVAPPFRFWDYGAYGGAISRWFAGDPIYIPADGGGYHGRYLYPPAALLLFLPTFVLLEFHGAAVLFQVVGVVVLWRALVHVVRLCGLDLAGLEQWLLLWALLGFQPLLLGMKLGQTAALLSGLLAAALAVLLASERLSPSTGDETGGGGEADRAVYGAVSGALTALVAAVKLPYAPAGAYLLRDRARLAGAAAMGLLFAGVSVGLFGVEAVRGFLDVLRWGLASGSSARPPTAWLPPYYRPLYWLPAPTLLRVGASLAIAAGAVLAGPDADRETFALGVVAVPLVAPRTYAYYFVAVLPAVVVLLAGELERERVGRPVVPVVAVFLLSVHSFGLKLVVDVLPAAVPAARALLPYAVAFQPGLWGNLLLVGLAGRRVADQVRRPAWAPSPATVRARLRR